MVPTVIFIHMLFYKTSAFVCSLEICDLPIRNSDILSYNTVCTNVFLFFFY